MKNSQRITAAICSLILTFSLVSCNTVSNPTPNSDNLESIDNTEKSENQKSEKGNLNLLTGTYDLPDYAVGKRPVSIMINNIKAALPQYGIGEADILYDALAEGGITRLMAVFSDYTKIPKIGPIRSARDYYLDFAQQYDSIFVNWGTSDIAARAIKNRNLDNIDGMFFSKYFFTDTVLAKKKAIEHCRFITADGLKKAIESKGNRLENKSNKSGFKFVSEGEEYIPAAQKCDYLKTYYSSSYDSTFEYDSTSKKYLVSEFGNPHMDAGTGKQLAFDNVVVVYADTNLVDGGNGKIGITLTKGDGIFATRGGAENISWKKGSPESPFIYSDINGAEISFNPGKTFVSVIPTTQQKYTELKGTDESPQV